MNDSLDNKLLENIETFVGFFESKIDCIEKAAFSQQGTLYKQCLYILILDSLAKTVFPNEKSNHKRFVTFIDTITKWKYSKKYSLTHLIQILELSHNAQLVQLLDYARNQQESWQKGFIISIEEDLDCEDIEKLCPESLWKEKIYKSIYLKDVRHGNLLYTYRSGLVHELRRPGYGMELSKTQNQPYYIGSSQLNFKNNEEMQWVSSWELVYPLNFFQVLCRDSVRNVKEYYIRENIDPYSVFNFGTYWLEQMNDND
ncbi:MAG: hypothetical protein H6Q69_929 [Firmicutes bacterium]|nr:hypothetical protein [Bacillota bacterium]